MNEAAHPIATPNEIPSAQKCVGSIFNEYSRLSKKIATYPKRPNISFGIMNILLYLLSRTSVQSSPRIHTGLSALTRLRIRYAVSTMPNMERAIIATIVNMV